MPLNGSRDYLVTGLIPRLDRNVFTLPGVVVCSVATIIILFLLSLRPVKLQRVGKPWLFTFFDGRYAISPKTAKQIEHGYTKIIKRTGKPFVMNWWCIDHVFLPPRYLLDVKRANFNDLSFSRSVYDIFLLYTSFGQSAGRSHNVMVDLVKKGINSRLSKLTSILNDECDYAFDVKLGKLETWKEFTAAPTMENIMHRIASRVLVGDELCRKDSYLDATQVLADSIVMNSLILSMFPLGPLRYVLSYLLSFVHRKRFRQAAKELLPTVQAKFDKSVSEDHAGTRKDSQDEVNSTGIDWIIELSRANGTVSDTSFLTHTLLLLVWAGSPPTAGLITQMVYQVLLEPQYLALLRSEADAAFTTYGFTETALNAMSLMDSFICETNRLYPTGTATCARTVMDSQGMKFHDGLYLPAGSKVVIPTLAIHTDPDNYKDPLVFDGFRFNGNLRSKSGETKSGNGDIESKSNPTAVSETKLAFGYGRHACPGRFYAVRMAKLAFGKLITNYDMKWDDVKVRPPSFFANGQAAPNLSQKIMLRKRLA